MAGLRFALPLALAVFVGVGFGILSWYFWVVLLFPVALGAAVGWASALGVAALAGRKVPFALTALALLAGFATEQVFEDHHQRRAFAESLFVTRAAGSGLDPEAIAALREVSGTAFLARDADAELDSQLEGRLGFGGPFGRFVSRLEAGVRLGGPWVGGRGLDLGLGGGLAAFALELFAAFLIARRIGRAALLAVDSHGVADVERDPGLDPPPGPG